MTSQYSFSATSPKFFNQSEQALRHYSTFLNDISTKFKRQLTTYHIRVFLDISHAGFSAVDRDFGFQLQDAPTVVDSHDYLLMSLIEVVDFQLI